MNRHRKLETALSSLLRNRMKKAIRDFPSCRVHGVRDLGCSLREFITYIERKWSDGMSWENHGQHGWHLDHVRPLASVDFNDPREASKAAHYTNYQPLWAEENRRKSARWRPPTAPGLTLHTATPTLGQILEVDVADDAINRALATVKQPKERAGLHDALRAEYDEGRRSGRVAEADWDRLVALAQSEKTLTIHGTFAIYEPVPGDPMHIFGEHFSVMIRT
jgi:hypothetical protein